MKLLSQKLSCVLPYRLMLIWALAILSVSGTVSAEGVSYTPIGGMYLLKMALALAVVLGVFYLLARIARQIQGGDNKASGVVKVLTGVSVGTRERLVVVEAGDVQMLLGISPAGIVKLREFDKPIIVTNQGEPTAPFKAHMEKLLDRVK